MITTLRLEEGSDDYLVGDGGQDGFASTWAASEQISDKLQGPYDFISEAQIAMEAEGNAIAAWIEQDAPESPESGSFRPSIIRARRYNGTTWEPPVLIAPQNGPRDLDSLQIAMSDSGSAIATFRGMDFWANRFDGSAWSLDVLLNYRAWNRINASDTAMNAAGKAIAVWAAGDAV